MRCVQRREVVMAHVDLAAHLDDLGHILRQRLRDVLDGADIGGDVLAIVPSPRVAAVTSLPFS